MTARKPTRDAQHDEHSAAYRRGMVEMHKQLGPMADAYIRRIKQLAPEFAWVNVTFPFGELYTRDVVDLKTRELCTIAALTVQGSSLPQLKIHIDAALRVGATRAEIVEIITQMIAYCGFPAATNALMTADAVFALHDVTDKKPKGRRRTAAASKAVGR
jgi:4-carboxymuconolactone decarboxylase